MVETRSQARRRHRDEVDDELDTTEVHTEGKCARNHADGDDDGDCCSDHDDGLFDVVDDEDDDGDVGHAPSAKRVHLNPVPRHRSVVRVVARGIVLACAVMAVYLTSRVAYRAWMV